MTGSYQNGGTLSGYALTSYYDAYLRKSSVDVRAPSGYWFGSTSYGYDNAARLYSVSANGATVTYSYLADSPLVSNITSQQSGTTRLTVNKTYDYLDRLQTIALSPSAATPLGCGYRYNDANQRVQMTLADGSFRVYEYDNLGQVKSGKRYWSDWTLVAGQQFEYGFDEFGNRISTKDGGDANSSSLRQASYSPNNLNQYSSRGVPGAIDVLGIANIGATVTVAGQSSYRRGEYFDTALSISNGSGPVYPSVTTWAVNGASSNSLTGNILMPAGNEGYSHDLDGNLSSDGLWNYTWDGENHLVMMQSSAVVPTAAKRQLTFEYDYQGRRIAKSFFNWNGFYYAYQGASKYVYDGWNLVAEFDGNDALVRIYSWGVDLSGSTQGAGGVGGLVPVFPASGITDFPAYDGNGNISAYVAGNTGQRAAQFEYGPFGEVIRAASSISTAIPIRWSTKYTDLETDLVYYGRRYYNPSTGRWLSRDPIGEKGGRNLYGFVQNNPVSLWDPFGDLMQGDELPVNYKGEKIGVVRIIQYDPNPFSGDMALVVDNEVGAILKAQVDISCKCGGAYKWRQHITEMRGQTLYKDNELDIGGRNAATHGEWFKDWGATPLSSTCAYTFVDNAYQPVNSRIILPENSPNRIDLVTVKFRLELVRLDKTGEKSGGETVLNIDWGYWYTRKANGLFNYGHSEE